MTKQDKLPLHSTPKHQSALLAAWLATVLIGVMAAGTGKAAPGDQWILDWDHTQTGSFLFWPGSGYNGGTAVEHSGYAGDSARIYWEMNDQLSVGTGNTFPNTTELYTIEWYIPNGTPEVNNQPVESQIGGSGGENYPIDSRIPWAAEYGTDHQYIVAPLGTAQTWVACGPGWHTPQGSAYNCLGDAGTFMWLTKGAYLYVKWDFGYASASQPIDRTWSALRLTQITPVTITSVSRSGNTVTVTWAAIAGKTYQLQSKTDLTQATWNNVGGTVTATGTTASAPDTVGANTRHFYQVVLQP